MEQQKEELGFYFICLGCDKYLKLTGDVDFEVVCPLCGEDLEEVCPSEFPEEKVTTIHM